MIGIYKIENLLNNKIYIGQSNDIERRFSEHCTKWKNSRIPVDYAIYKHGKENFSFEVVEECSIEELNEKEQYWIDYYKSYPLGYNCNPGGEQQSVGSFNGKAKLNEEDIKVIRTAYNNHERQRKVYEQFKDKVTWGSFQNIWQGRSWKHVMPEVFTLENKEYYCKKATNGEKSSKAQFSDEEVVVIRNRYVQETAKHIYEDYKDRVSFQTLQQILWGRSYSHLPIYSKKQKQWIN